MKKEYTVYYKAQLLSSMLQLIDGLLDPIPYWPTRDYDMFSLEMVRTHLVAAGVERGPP